MQAARLYLAKAWFSAHSGPCRCIAAAQSPRRHSSYSSTLAAGRPRHPADATDQHHAGRDVRRGGEDLHPAFDTIDDRQQAAGVDRRILDVADVRHTTQPLDHRQAEVRTLEARVGVQHHRQRHRLADRPEVREHAVVGEREVGLEDGENAVGPEPLPLARLIDGVGGRGRGHAGNDRHTAGGRLDDHLDHPSALVAAQVGELAGRSERRQPVHAGADQVLAQTAEDFVLDPAALVDRRDEVRKDPVKRRILHRIPASSDARSRRAAAIEPAAGPARSVRRRPSAAAVKTKRLGAATPALRCPYLCSSAGWVTRAVAPPRDALSPRFSQRASNASR